MNRFLCAFCLVLLMCLAAKRADAQTSAGYLTMPSELIPFNSAEGKQMFQESKYKEAFWQLAQFYITQPDPGSCSVASCTMVLNALPIERPDSSVYGSYKLFTPGNFFTPAVEAIRPKAAVSAAGMTLDQLAQVLATYSVDAQPEHATPDRLTAFRAKIKETLQHPDAFILVNYLRKAVGQQTGGHISPLGAYHEGKDMVLVLDVSNYKYPWTWVKVDQLWQAMEAVDDDSKMPRGYVVVTPKPKP